MSPNYTSQQTLFSQPTSSFEQCHMCSCRRHAEPQITFNTKPCLSQHTSSPEQCHTCSCRRHAEPQITFHMKSCNSQRRSSPEQNHAFSSRRHAEALSTTHTNYVLHSKRHSLSNITLFLAGGTQGDRQQDTQEKIHQRQGTEFQGMGFALGFSQGAGFRV
jgi:hypothetical protein